MIQILLLTIFLKTFFCLEKVNAVIPNTEETTPVLILFDCGSGKTVGNYVESLDGYEQMKTTNIVLSSLNGDDSTQKRVCQVTILGHDGKQFPLDVIIPKEEIPKPAPQSMECFMKKETKKVKNSYIDKITQQDIDTLPLILLGVNIKSFSQNQKSHVRELLIKVLILVSLEVNFQINFLYLELKK